MTTKEVIKILPIEEQLKTQLLNMFDYLEPDQRLSIERLAWNLYHELYKERLEDNIQKQLDEVIEGEEKFGEDFYARAVKKTKDDMQKYTSEGSTEFDLSAARIAMQQIMDEIHAAKKNKHRKPN